MAGNGGGNPVSHFGRQVRKERLARGWSLDELARRTDIAAGHWSRIENGKRPPTELIAAKCDEAFPERRGYFTEYYDESRSWMPPGFRDWSEIENKASTLRDWTPSIMTGLVQTEGYAHALLETSLGATTEAVAMRLSNRMARRQRVLLRDDPPRASFLVDEFALYRLVGSPEVMADQMHCLAEVAKMPNVTIQILPAVAHPANASGFVVTDDAALCEHVRGAYVYTDDQTVSSLLMTFDRLRGECYRVSESAVIINRTESTWATGVSPLTATPTAGTALKSRPAT
jgi:transcriptional regulator with XRE-family HTH domain